MVKSIPPVADPLQRISVLTEVTVMLEGWETVKLNWFEQLLLSVMVTS